jgi:hypothetical protein
MNTSDLVALNMVLRALRVSRATELSVIANKGELDGGVCFVQKPFSTQSLSAKIREVPG